MPIQLDTNRISKQTGTIAGPADGAIAGGVNIEQIALIQYSRRGLTLEAFDTKSNFKTVDLLHRAKQVDIFYSIFSNVIHCEIQIVDSINQLQNSDDPIIGEEYVVLQYRTPTSNDSIRLLFRAYSVTDITNNDANKSRAYTLMCVSPEAIENAARTVYRKLTTDTGDDGSRITDVIQNILSTDLGTDKPITIEPSSGIVNKYLLNMYPLEAVDYLRQCAVSTNRESSSFVFFERPDGYVFTTLEEIFAQSSQYKNVPSYIFDTIKHSDHSLPINNRALAFNEAQYVDNYTKIVNGGISNAVESIDLITGKFDTTLYSHLQSQDTFKYAESADRGYRNTKEFVQDFVEDIPSSKTIVVAATDNSTNLAKKLARQQAYALELTQSIVQMSVYGNTEVMCGDVINVDVISPNGTPPDVNEEQQVERAVAISSRYMIAKLRDTIKISDNPQHIQSFEMIKGHFLQE